MEMRFGFAFLVSLPLLTPVNLYSKETRATRCEVLLRRLVKNPKSIYKAEQLKFSGVGDRDVYNPTAPFEIAFQGKKKTVVAGRVEPRDQENAQVMFFEKKGDLWVAIPVDPISDTQDPFVTRVGDKVVLGGVRTFERPEGGLGYKTIFYRIGDLAEIRNQKPREGPVGMKDIRFVTLPDRKLLMATRPQGGANGPGRVGFKIVNGYDEVTTENILSAKILPNLFSSDEWGGVNEMHVLKDGRIGVLGHIARFDTEIRNGQKTRHYYPMTFVFDPKTGTHTAPKLVLQRSDLDRYGISKEAKRSDLVDVLFSGGIVRNGDGTATLFVGAGDAVVVQIDLEKDPFLD